MSEYRAEFGNPASIEPDTPVIGTRREALRKATAAFLGSIGVGSVRGVRFVRGAAEEFMFNPGIGAAMPDWVLGSHVVYRFSVPLEAHAQKLVDLASNMGFQPPAEIAMVQPHVAEAPRQSIEQSIEL